MTTGKEQPFSSTTQINVAEIRAQVSSLTEAVNRVESTITHMANQVSVVDKQLTNMMTRAEVSVEAMNRLAAQVTELGSWRNSLELELSNQAHRTAASVDAKVAAVETKADEAIAGVQRIENTGNGASLAIRWGGAIFGSILLSAVIWVVTTAQTTRERLAVVEYQLSRVDSKQAGK